MHLGTHSGCLHRKAQYVSWHMHMPFNTTLAVQSMVVLQGGFRAQASGTSLTPHDTCLFVCSGLAVVCEPVYGVLSSTALCNSLHTHYTWFWLRVLTQTCWNAVSWSACVPSACMCTLEDLERSNAFVSIIVSHALEASWGEASTFTYLVTAWLTSLILIRGVALRTGTLCIVASLSQAHSA